MATCLNCSREIKIRVVKGIRTPIHNCADEYSHYDSYTTKLNCPTCSKSVFFYQNDAGSKVFFDQLGPPWPKHDCLNKEVFEKSRENNRLKPARIKKNQSRGRGLQVTLLGRDYSGEFSFPAGSKRKELIMINHRNAPAFIKVSRIGENMSLTLSTFLTIRTSQINSIVESIVIRMEIPKEKYYRIIKK